MGLSKHRYVVIDIETDGLDPSVIWCICTKDIGSGEIKEFTHAKGYTDFVSYAATVNVWITHNGLSFDVPVINRIIGQTIDPSNVIDTFVISRLINYPGYRTHSLAEIGLLLGFPKTVFDDWSKCTPEMIEYCHNDVLITEKVYKKYRAYTEDLGWAKSIQCEHMMTLVCNDMQNTGFYFNVQAAKHMLVDVVHRMEQSEEMFEQVWKPELRYVRSIAYRWKKDGGLHSNVIKAQEVYPKTVLVGDQLELYEYFIFNPKSSKDRVDKLWDAGWKPTEKTKAHSKFSMKGGRLVGTKLTAEQYAYKKEYFGYYGWTVSEENLATLPNSAPDAAKALTAWLTLNGRKTALEERIRCTQKDLRIHAKFWNIGAWTHRMSHSHPNLANVSSPFTGEPTNSVEVIKALYDTKMRAMFLVDQGYLLGTDAEGIQLRILAHYLKNDDYVHAIVSGRKEDETDIHNVNRRALGLSSITRGNAKTFIYAWLLGAGAGKVARILGCNVATAQTCIQRFIDSTEGLVRLKTGRINRDAGRGYFEGLDGRKVMQNKAFYMLAGYLQNGEVVVMKHANLLWRKWADEAGIKYKQLNFVHDEWQTQVLGSLDAVERLGAFQRESIVTVGKEFKLYCPLAASSKIGHTWLDTH